MKIDYRFALEMFRDRLLDDLDDQKYIEETYQSCLEDASYEADINENSKQQLQLLKLSRKVLRHFAESSDITDCQPYIFMSRCLEITEDLYERLVKYMYAAGLVKESYYAQIRLTARGIQIAQNIGNDSFWDSALRICDEKEIYSFDAILKTYFDIAQSELKKSIEKR